MPTTGMFGGRCCCGGGGGRVARDVKEEELPVYSLGAQAAAGAAGAATPRARRLPRAMARVVGVWHVGPPPTGRVRFRVVWSDGRSSWVPKENFEPHQTPLYEAAATQLLLAPPSFDV